MIQRAKWADPYFVCASGFAELPKGSPAYELYRVVAFVMIVDTRTDEIVDAGFSFVLDQTNEFVRSLVIGENVLTGVENIHRRIKTRFLSPVQGALIQAVRNAFDRYNDWKRNGQDLGRVKFRPEHGEEKP